MDPVDEVWKLEHLSDAQLLQSLGGVLRKQRRTLADLTAHLAEVEDRRLHLQAPCSSMFAYCVERLGMSEDEACRRIELARLARRFPALFAELASGRLTLSVALALKPVLTPDNHLELLAAARSKNMRQARELVAERFPKPDAPSIIRKLPESQHATTAQPAQPSLPAQPLPAQPSLPAQPLPAQPLPQQPLQRQPLLTLTPALPSSQLPLAVATPDANSSLSPRLWPPSLTASSSLPDPPAAFSPAGVPQSLSPRDDTASRVSRGRIEPLSAGRYRVQFTADLELKQKLELARDLLRHTYPNGDFACIFSRALQLLLDQLMARRLGANPRHKGARPTPKKAEATPPPAPASESPACASKASAAKASAPASEALASESPPPSSAPASESPASPAALAANPPAALTMPVPTPKRRPYIPRAARRAVFERDGLGCSWVNEHGVRCGSRAWLEIDHRAPAAKNGTSEPDNLRLLCRSHNRLAAEQAFGREHIDRCSTRRRHGERSRTAPGE